MSLGTASAPTSRQTLRRPHVPRRRVGVNARGFLFCLPFAGAGFGFSMAHSGSCVRAADTGRGATCCYQERHVTRLETTGEARNVSSLFQTEEAALPFRRVAGE